MRLGGQLAYLQQRGVGLTDFNATKRKQCQAQPERPTDGAAHHPALSKRSAPSPSPQARAQRPHCAIKPLKHVARRALHVRDDHLAAVRLAHRQALPQPQRPLDQQGVRPCRALRAFAAAARRRPFFSGVLTGVAVAAEGAAAAAAAAARRRQARLGRQYPPAKDRVDRVGCLVVGALCARREGGRASGWLQEGTHQEGGQQRRWGGGADPLRLLVSTSSWAAHRCPQQTVGLRARAAGRRHPVAFQCLPRRHSRARRPRAHSTWHAARRASSAARERAARQPAGMGCSALAGGPHPARMHPTAALRAGRAGPGRDPSPHLATRPRAPRPPHLAPERHHPRVVPPVAQQYRALKSRDVLIKAAARLGRQDNGGKRVDGACNERPGGKRRGSEEMRADAGSFTGGVVRMCGSTPARATAYPGARLPAGFGTAGARRPRAGRKRGREGTQRLPGLTGCATTGAQ
jgi:hypothetical protein